MKFSMKSAGTTSLTTDFLYSILFLPQYCVNVRSRLIQNISLLKIQSDISSTKYLTILMSLILLFLFLGSFIVNF